MKVSKAQAAENRQGILDAAARLYRERGLTGVGVADITRDAGLTHGGLYRHFASKDVLVQEACTKAFDWSIPVLDGERPHATVGDRIQRYLSPEHRDAPGSGCPVAALAVDAGGATPSPQDRARAIHVLATMVGGMVLARATAAAQPALSNELMATLQTQLTDWLDNTSSPSK